PELELEALEEALGRAAGDPFEDAARSAVRALAARGRAEVRERGGVILALERAAADRRHLVSREAAAGLAALGAEAPALRPVATGRSPAVYREILERTRAPRRVALETERGQLELELDCPRAPLTCLSFLQLAHAGFFDGLTFHRVVPDFVVQGGDPRGDGWGGPGYALRDEINRLRYRRGTVGMALAGADTGGSQFFVALSPQPHLDGGYTAFGRVVGGDEILDRIVQGERILRAREIGAGAGSLQ
ncbi:MAG TPA: peptidylprolyl isomerase, partial [Thermoanaerobaculia bacterium]|nr:peptidylprolyl isomerase [Thermoanaerobaculia bacterium]